MLNTSLSTKFINFEWIRPFTGICSRNIVSHVSPDIYMIRILKPLQQTIVALVPQKFNFNINNCGFISFGISLLMILISLLYIFCFYSGFLFANVLWLFLLYFLDVVHWLFNIFLLLLLPLHFRPLFDKTILLGILIFNDKSISNTHRFSNHPPIHSYFINFNIKFYLSLLFSLNVPLDARNCILIEVDADMLILFRIYANLCLSTNADYLRRDCGCSRWVEPSITKFWILTSWRHDEGLFSCLSVRLEFRDARVTSLSR